MVYILSVSLLSSVYLRFWEPSRWGGYRLFTGGGDIASMPHHPPVTLVRCTIVLVCECPVRPPQPDT